MKRAVRMADIAQQLGISTVSVSKALADKTAGRISGGCEANGGKVTIFPDSGQIMVVVIPRKYYIEFWEPQSLPYLPFLR